MTTGDIALPRRYSWPIVGLVSLLLPPLGLVLLWLRPATGAVKKVALSLPILALGVSYAFLFTDLRVEVDGSGMRPLVSYYDGDAHFEALEASRQRQAPPAPPAEAEPAQPAAVSDTTDAGEPVEPARIEPAAAADEREAAPPEPAPAVAEGAAWSDFRGPRRDGRTDAPIRTDWPSEGLPRLWRQPIGGGYASFAVAGARAFTIEQRRNEEVVAAYDVMTGRELWTNVWEAHFSEPMGGEGPRATPTWSAGRLYALGATGELRCLDAATGAALWRRNILEDNQAGNLHWAMAGSPLVVDGKVIVQPGGAAGRSVVAYDAVSGEPVWHALDDVEGYTSPMLVTLAGRRQILVVTAQRAVGLDVADGGLLWEYPWVVSNVPNITQPVLLGDDRVLLSASYGKGSAAFVVAEKDGRLHAETVWETTRMKNKQSASVLYEGYLYGLDERILTCIDAGSGELAWKGGRYGFGQLLLADGHLVVLTESGDVVLVEANPRQHVELARFTAIDGKTWSSPVIAGGRLLVRNTTEMAAFDISPD